jgi:AraC-like DNA-binding protein
LEPTIVANLLADLPKSAGGNLYSPGFSIAPVTDELLDAWVRMLRLMERSADIAVLAPAYEREILYRVLQGPLGWMLRDIAAPCTALSRVSIAIQWIRENFTRPVRVEALAAMAALSVPAFHQHFKAVTALSPLQYQKRIRLLHARSLLIAGAGNATSIAFGVGYKSPTSLAGNTRAILVCHRRRILCRSCIASIRRWPSRGACLESVESERYFPGIL